MAETKAPNGSKAPKGYHLTLGNTSFTAYLTKAMEAGALVDKVRTDGTTAGPTKAVKAVGGAWRDLVPGVRVLE